jgi:antitoxin component YwqK of YwqJK toxin-antitoxin module
MRTLLAIIMTCLFSNSLIGQDTLFFDSKWNETTKEKSKFFRIEKQENNKWLRTDYFSENNQIQMKGHYISLNPEKEDGYFEWFHSNGKIKHTGNYLNGEPIGEHLWYFDNGNIEAVENYKNGKLNGIFKEYYQNGNLNTETEFVDEIQFGYTKYFREDNSLHSEGNFKNGERNGLWKFYDESGNLVGTDEFETEYEITEANLFLKLPNTEWYLADKKQEKLTEYYFKRNPITDKNGIEIIPAIMVFVEDASSYNQDVTLYSIWKQKPFKESGIKTEKILVQDSEGFPLTYKNAYFIQNSYTAEGLDHLLFMIHIINKENKGIQIYLDMTKDIAEEYEKEFWKTIESIREL